MVANCAIPDGLGTDSESKDFDDDSDYYLYAPRVFTRERFLTERETKNTLVQRGLAGRERFLDASAKLKRSLGFEFVIYGINFSPSSTTDL